LGIYLVRVLSGLGSYPIAGFDVRSVEPLGSITRELLTPLDNTGHKSERIPRYPCQTKGKTGVEIFTF
jgi:hypothetical protein